MVQARIENGFVVCIISFYFYNAQFVIPRFFGLLIYLIKSSITHFFIKILSRVCNAHVRNADFHHDLRGLFKIILHIGTDAISHHFAHKLFFEACFTVVTHPLCFYTFIACRFIPNAKILRCFRNACNKIHRIRTFSIIVAKRSYHSVAFNFCWRIEFKHRTVLISKTET